MTETSLPLADFIRARGFPAEIVEPGVPMPTVDAAAAAMGVAPERIFKSILFQAKDGRCVMVVACGNGRVDVKRIQGLTGLRGRRPPRALGEDPDCRHHPSQRRHGRRRGGE